MQRTLPQSPRTASERNKSGCHNGSSNEANINEYLSITSHCFSHDTIIAFILKEATDKSRNEACSATVALPTNAAACKVLVTFASLAKTKSKKASIGIVRT